MYPIQFNSVIIFIQLHTLKYMYIMKHYIYNKSGKGDYKKHNAYNYKYC